MKYTKDEPVSRTKLDFISENVQQMGMNLASLKGGFRLPKDYIHPEDRNGFIDAVSIAAETQTDFTYRVRLVGDDGVIRNVDVTSEYIDLDADYYLIEYIFHEIVAPVGGNAAAAKKSSSTPQKLTKEIFSEEELGELFGLFANAYGLYSTVVDLDGRSLLPPVGPEAYLGHYYDMFERPENKELFEGIKRAAITQDDAVYMELGYANPDSRVSAVALMINGVHLATWMLCSHDKTQTAALRLASREQYRLGKLISLFIQKTALSGRRSEREKEIEYQLAFEKKQKKVLAELQDVIRQEGVDNIQIILKEAKDVLQAEYAFLMRKFKKSDVTERISSYASTNGKEPLEVNFDAFNDEEREKIADEGYVVDQTTMTNRIRVSVFQGFSRAAIIMPVYVGTELLGKVVFLETERERSWTESEIHFARLIGRMIGETIEYKENLGIRKSSGRELLEVFHQLTINVFVRDDETGKVLFSNRALNNHLGMDFVGMDSRRIVPEGKEEFESYPSTLHEEAAQSNGVRKWRRYIDELGGIYDVTEIPMEWLDGSPATAVLLRIAQD